MNKTKFGNAEQLFTLNRRNTTIFKKWPLFVCSETGSGTKPIVRIIIKDLSCREKSTEQLYQTKICTLCLKKSVNGNKLQNHQNIIFANFEVIYDKVPKLQMSFNFDTIYFLRFKQMVYKIKQWE